MPYQADNHFGKEVFTNRYFLLKQKGIYPIMAAVGLGLVIAAASSLKHMYGNNNVTFAHSHLGAWNSTPLNTLDVAHKQRPKTRKVFSPVDDSL